jgi:CIC family chloride channel protein
VTGTLVGQLTLGDRLAFQVPDFHLTSWTEILLFPLLGIACGFVTITFRLLLTFVRDLMRQLPGPPLLRPAIAGIAVGAMAASGLPDAMGNGYARLEPLIAIEHPAAGYLGLLLGAKLVATALSAASRAGGGLFAPTLFMGGVTGLLCGRAAAFIFPGVEPDAGTFAIAGMAGVGATVAHAPVTMAIMLAEMTGNYAIILPLLVTIATASLVTTASFRHSLYVQSLIDRGIRLDHTPEELVVHGLRVRDVMAERGYLTIGPDTKLDELARLFLEHRQDRLFVVDPDGRFIGLVDLQDVKGVLHQPKPGDARTARTLARTMKTAGPDTPMADIMESFFVTGQDAVAVVGEDGRMAGIVTERDVMGALNREILRRDVGLARIESGPADDRSTDFFELPPGYAVTSLPSAEVAGHTLAELDLTKRLGVVVLAIDVWDETLGRHRRVPPSADIVLGPRDGYVVMGPSDLVKSLGRR